MPFDVRAAEALAEQVIRAFNDGIQSLIAAAAKEAEIEWQRIDHESQSLAMDRRRLEEAWAHLHTAEMSRLESCSGAAAASASASAAAMLSPTTHIPRGEWPRSEWVPLHNSHNSAAPPPPSQQALANAAPGPLGTVPPTCTVTLGRYAYSVLPLQEPSAPNLGHDLWNHTIDIPDGWEVVSLAVTGFDNAVAQLTQNRWGAMVVGVRNAKQGFDAYWTPLFGDGSHAGKLCEADVDWIEPIGDEGRSFRMNYSGLRLAIRTQRPVVAAPHGQPPVPQLQLQHQIYSAAAGNRVQQQPQLLSYTGAGNRLPMTPMMQGHLIQSVGPHQGPGVIVRQPK